jgi:Amino acid transporters
VGAAARVLGPLAITFGALGVRHPVSGGVSAYVREGFGDNAAAVTGNTFITAVLFGAPAVALIGGYYVAALTGSGTSVAVVVAVLIVAVVFGANTLGLRISSGFQLGLSAVLVAVIAIAVGVALPSRARTTGRRSRRTAGGRSGRRRTSSSGSSSAGRRWRNSPATSATRSATCRARWRSRSVSSPFSTWGLAAATIAVTAGSGSRVPLADLIAVGFGHVGRDATAVLALALTMGR